MSERPGWLTEPARPAGTERAREGSAARGRGSGPRSGAGGGRDKGAGRRRRGGLVAGRARFERRAAAVRRRPLALVTTAVLIVAVVGGLVWLVEVSSVLAVRTVTVAGLSDPKEQRAVLDAAAVPLGTPLARVDTSGTAERVGRIPTIASVTVGRSWPSTVVVSVQRKVPVLAIRNPQGQLQVVDGSGVPFETVAQLPPGVAQVNVSSTAPDPQGVKAAINVVQLLTPAQRAILSGITVTSADLVTFQLGRVTVVWGGVADGPKKVAVLDALLPTNPSLVDVSAPDTPVTR